MFAVGQVVKSVKGLATVQGYNEQKKLYDVLTLDARHSFNAKEEELQEYVQRPPRRGNHNKPVITATTDLTQQVEE